LEAAKRLAMIRKAARELRNFETMIATLLVSDQ
jgi:hypothetical protein